MKLEFQYPIFTDISTHTHFTILSESDQILTFYNIIGEFLQEDYFSNYYLKLSFI